MKNRCRRGVGLLLGLVLLVAACDGGSSSQYNSSDPEYQLADLDDKSAELNDDTISPYAQALDGLQARCRDSRSMIADYTVESQPLLAGSPSGDLSLLELLRTFALLIPAGETGLACDQVFADLVTILKNA